MKRLISCGITLTIFGLTAVMLWYFLGQPTADEAFDRVKGAYGDFRDVLQNGTDIDWGSLGLLDEDPFVGDNTTNAWATKGEGLSLELQNALDEMWQDEFAEAVADWRESEVLTLSTTKVAVDHSCGRVDGVMLVCNGNFGETGWVGINEVEIQTRSANGPGFIIGSVAKMNEYYLNNAPYEKRLYTMCHEIGHGFGLPHTDENPNNSDLGNCLDYTRTPENNLRPGKANFDRLKSIYLAGEGDSLAGSVAQEDSVRVDETRDGQRNLRRVVITHYLYDF